MHFPLRFTGVAGTTLVSLVENCNGRVCSTFSKAGTSRVDTFSYIYVTHAGTGEIKIFRGSDDAQVGSVKLLEDADSIGYDPDTKHLRVTNGGDGAHLEYALASGKKWAVKRPSEVS
jgi:hypothetical protein